MRTAGLVAAAAGTLALLLPGRADAQSFPARAVRIVVPYPAGGPTDVLARILAQEMTGALGQPVLVENKPGASGAVGTREVARAAPDGHTLVLGTNQTHATNAVLLKDPGYDPLVHFVAIAGIAELQHALVVPKRAAARGVGELVDLAKRQPGKLNYGSTGLGSASHLAMELFQLRTGTRLTHVPFRGAAPMAVEIIAGRIDAAFATLSSVLGQIESGEIRALGLASGMRAPQLPTLATLAEQGIREAESDAWLALFAPAGTPAPTTARLERAVRDAMSKTTVRDSAIRAGLSVNIRSGPAFAAFLVRDIFIWQAVIKAAGLTAE